jgi:hypothetical protein
MNCNRPWGKILMAVIGMSLVAAAVPALAQFRTLYAFKGGVDGVMPTDRLVQDSSGNLYGTTLYGGEGNDAHSGCQDLCGTVFELSRLSNGDWQKMTLYGFTGKKDGGNPEGAMAIDTAGNLYGTTQFYAAFELSPAAGGGWTESTIFSFYFGPSWLPDGVVQDASGNLYGIARSSGGDGILYELSPVGGGVWTETTLYSFGLYGEFGAPSELTMDGRGDILGASLPGTVDGLVCYYTVPVDCGTMFELSPESSGVWTFSDFEFPTPNRGGEPSGSVVEDSSGNVFGTTLIGGADGDGIMYELSPVAGGAWKESIRYIFDGTKGSSPTGLISDGNGGFYGTTLSGGSANCTSGCGVVFHLTQTATGGWTERVLHSFTGGFDGEMPNELIRDANGNLYGTTRAGGSAVCKCGTVFEIVDPTGSAR